MTTQTTNRVQPGALFTYQDSEDLPVLMIEVTKIDIEDGAALCVESLSNDARLTNAAYDIETLDTGTFTYVGNVRPEAEQRLYAPREGDLFLYRIDPSYDWPTAEYFVAEVVHLERDSSVTTLVTSGADARGYWENWTPSEVVARFAYAGHVGTGRER